MTTTERRILVAGVGNIFLGDDGFGVEVAKRLRAEPMPAGVEVEDFGIRGVHLAYKLLEGYDSLILVDAASHGEPPGSVFVFEPDLSPERGPENPFLIDAHGLDPELVLGMLVNLGGHIDRVLVVGCEPIEVTERIGLSDAVEVAVGQAMNLVRELIREQLTQQPSAAPASDG